MTNGEGRALPTRGARACRGFTLLELLVVLAILALLLSIVTPRYVGRVDKAEETALRQDLAVMRDGLDKYYADRGTYPDSLQDLVTRRYLRNIPPDPITRSATTWVTVPPQDAATGRVYDVHSGAPGDGLDGTPYADW